MPTALAERWHMEIKRFHLAVREMTITLHYVSYRLYILIQGKMMTHMTNIFQYQGVELMNELCGVSYDYAADDCEKMFGAHIGFAWVEEIFEENLTRACNLENTT